MQTANKIEKNEVQNQGNLDLTALLKVNTMAKHRTGRDGGDIIRIKRPHARGTASKTKETEIDRDGSQSESGSDGDGSRWAQEKLRLH